MSKLKIERRIPEITSMCELKSNITAIMKGSKIEELESLNVDMKKYLITAVFNKD